jgi:hypothetical protein
MRINKLWTTAALTAMCGACTGLAYANLTTGDDPGDPSGSRPSGPEFPVAQRGGEFATTIAVKAFTAPDGLCFSSASPDGERDVSTVCIDPSRAPYDREGVTEVLRQDRGDSVLVIGLASSDVAAVEVTGNGAQQRVATHALDASLGAGTQNRVFVADLPAGKGRATMRALDASGA